MKSKTHKLKPGKKCDWCDNNRVCIATLERALAVAPTAYEMTIQLVIDALVAEVRGCERRPK